MKKRIVSKIVFYLLILSLINYISCYSYQEITKEEFNQTEEYVDLQVRTTNQYIYQFDENNYTVMEDSIYGSGRIKLKNSNKHFEDYTGSVYLEDIESIKFDKFNTAITVLVIAVGVGLIVLGLTGEHQPKGFPL